jgi:hypothetical protein
MLWANSWLVPCSGEQRATGLLQTEVRNVWGNVVEIEYPSQARAGLHAAGHVPAPFVLIAALAVSDAKCQPQLWVRG